MGSRGVFIFHWQFSIVFTRKLIRGLQVSVTLPRKSYIRIQFRIWLIYRSMSLSPLSERQGEREIDGGGVGKGVEKERVPRKPEKKLGWMIVRCSRVAKRCGHTRVFNVEWISTQLIYLIVFQPEFLSQREKMLGFHRHVSKKTNSKTIQWIYLIMML